MGREDEGKETGQSVSRYIIPGGASLAIGAGRERGEGEEGQQDEIHMPGARPERMGQAGHAVNLRRLLRGRRRRNLPDAGRAGRRSRVTRRAGSEPLGPRTFRSVAATRPRFPQRPVCSRADFRRFRCCLNAGFRVP